MFPPSNRADETSGGPPASGASGASRDFTTPDDPGEPAGTPSSSVPAGAGHRYALLVGVDKYVDPAVPALSFCVSDVRVLEQVLSDLGYIVTCLHDEAKKEWLLPTRDNVEAELAKLCNAVGPPDLLLVHFACHGKLVNEQPVLMTREVRFQNLAERALPIKKIEEAMRASKARGLVLTLDACHSGVRMGRSVTDDDFNRNAHDLAAGFALIAGSSAEQVAQEWEAKRHGVFTYFLLEALSGKADRANKRFVTVDDVKTYVLAGLRTWNLAHSALPQEPTARIEGFGDMILADFRDGRRVSIKRRSPWPLVGAGALGCAVLLSAGFAVHRARNPLLPKPYPGAAGSPEQEVAKFVDAFLLGRLQDMEQAGLRQASLADSPWSSDPWRIMHGGIARRYADPSIRYTDDVQSNTEQVRSSTPIRTEDYSPAEKYGLLIGDEPRDFVQAVLRQEDRRCGHSPPVDCSASSEPLKCMSLNKVIDLDCLRDSPTWENASIHVPRPRRVVQVMAADGKTLIPFYPADIKALIVALWTSPQTRLSKNTVGELCNEKSPQRDDAGYIFPPACADLDPSVWHLAVVNQIGKARRSFFIDAEYADPVRLFPMKGYRYDYFNPKRPDVAVSSLKEASAAIADLPRDKHSARRSKDAVSVVGISMTVTGVLSAPASHADQDSAEQDRSEQITYRYDLEIDRSGWLIGGRWYQPEHPDRAIALPPNTAVHTKWDAMAKQAGWDGTTPLPASWRYAAQKAAEEGVPLPVIVDALLALSRKAGG